ncbi:hypothetical protein ACTXMZ_07370, partial [Brachybacterium alimentarium]
ITRAHHQRPIGDATTTPNAHPAHAHANANANAGPDQGQLPRERRTRDHGAENGEPPRRQRAPVSPAGQW